MIKGTQEKGAVVSGSEPQLHIGFKVSRKLCLNLCSFRWLKFSLKRVSNLMPLLSWIAKTEYSEALMKLSNAFLNNIGEGTDFMSSLKLFRSWEQRILATYLLLSPFSRYLSAWHFSRSVLWVYFYFPVTNILRTNNTTRWRKNKQKNTHQYSASFEALKYSNISTFDSSIRKFEHFNTSIQWVLLNRTPTSTQLHPPLPSSTQLHPPPPSSFQPPPSTF